eukprot:g37909.t1
MISGMEVFSYEQMLSRLGLYSLEFRRMRVDLIEMYWDFTRHMVLMNFTIPVQHVSLCLCSAISVVAFDVEDEFLEYKSIPLSRKRKLIRQIEVFLIAMMKTICFTKQVPSFTVSGNASLTVNLALRQLLRLLFVPKYRLDPFTMSGYLEMVPQRLL